MASVAGPPAGPPREPPPVTVTGGRASTPAPDVLDAGPPARRTGPWLLGLAAGLVLLVAVASADRRPPPAPPPLDVRLTAASGELLGSQGGVLVVPVEVQGAIGGVPVEVRLERAVVWAEPVREQPTATGRTRFDTDGGRLQVLLQPDCRLLGPDSGIVFAATLQVDVTGGGGREASAVLDLAAQPALAGRISALCRPGDGLRVPGPPGGAPAAPLADPGAAVGCPQGLCTGARDALREAAGG